LKKKEFLPQDNKVCNFIAFIAEGSIRHFHIKDGVEKTCDISFESSWVTDFQMFQLRHIRKNEFASNGKHDSFFLQFLDNTITEITYTLGFEDSSYFARYFKKHTHMSPLVFKKKLQ